MKLRNPRLIRFVAFLAAFVIRTWMATVRVRVVNLDGRAHPPDADGGSCIYAFWHESLARPRELPRQGSWRVLISKHADGELIAQACRLSGVRRRPRVDDARRRAGRWWSCGIAATGSHLVFTPDGPRGPAGKVQPGMIMLASQVGASDRAASGSASVAAWRARSWDRFAVPWPFSACVCRRGRRSTCRPTSTARGSSDYRRLVEERMLEPPRTPSAGLARRAAQGPHRRLGPDSRVLADSEPDSTPTPSSPAEPVEGRWQDARNEVSRWTDRNCAVLAELLEETTGRAPPRGRPRTSPSRKAWGSTRSTCSA